MSSYGDQLQAATQEGGRPDGWPEDVWSLVVWAAIGCEAWPDETPEADAARQRQQGGDPAVALESLASVELVGQPVGVILAAAWAGRAQHALRRRDEAIQELDTSISLRQIAARTGLTGAGVSKIRKRAEQR